MKFPTHEESRENFQAQATIHPREDKRRFYKTATIARSGSVFKEGEVVSITLRMSGPIWWMYDCRLGDREAGYSEEFLRDFKF